MGRNLRRDEGGRVSRGSPRAFAVVRSVVAVARRRAALVVVDRAVVVLVGLGHEQLQLGRAEPEVGVLHQRIELVVAARATTTETTETKTEGEG